MNKEMHYFAKSFPQLDLKLSDDGYKFQNTDTQTKFEFWFAGVTHTILCTVTYYLSHSYGWCVIDTNGFTLKNKLESRSKAIEWSIDNGYRPSEDTKDN